MNLNFQDFFKFATSHRSIRQFQNKSIESHLLSEILAVGARASTAGNMQAYSIIVSHDLATRQKLYEAHNQQDMILQAPTTLTFCADFNRMRRWAKLTGVPDEQQSFDDLLGFLTAAVDVSLVAQNTALAAEAAGLGICYMGTTLWAMEEISHILNLPEFVVPVTSLVIGYPADGALQGTQLDRLPEKLIIHEEKYQELSDSEFLSGFAHKEKLSEERYKKSLRLLKLRALYDIQSVAGMYSAPFKYSKNLHRDVSQKILKFLSKKGFWNH